MNSLKSKPNSSPKQKVNSTPLHFECVYCHRHYVKESAFLNHECKAKERIEMSKTPLGQASYMFYAKWMHSCKRSIPPMSTFLSSKFYEPFVRFAKFNKSLQLPSVDLYIQVMLQKNITPELWTDDRAYAIYLEHMEYHIDPLLSIRITSDTLSILADEYECDISEVFTKCRRTEIIQLVRERKLSPWILLKSSKFGQFIDSLNSDELGIMENLIDSSFWKKKFKNDPKTTKFVGTCVRELGI